VILLAALLVGSACALAAGHLWGTAGALTRWRPPVRTGPSATRVWLQQAGVELGPVQFWFGSVAAGLAAFLALTAVCGSPLVAVVPAGAVALMPRAYFGRRRTRRLAEVQRSWPDGLRDVLASIAAGRSVGQALTALAEDGPEPLRAAFERFPTLQRMLGTVAALEIVKEELADATSDRVLEVLVLAHERGGQLVTEILEDLVATTTADLKTREEVETDGLEMRINARAVVVLPWCVLVLLTAGEPSFRAFYRSSAGFAVLLVGAVLSAAGTAVLARLGRTPTEGRVFDTPTVRALP
jgi:tight adherence protein B